MKYSFSTRIRSVVATALCGFALGVSGNALADTDWPTKEIRLIVPFGAGGASDAVGRAVGQYLSDSLGQPVVVENRTGAGGSIGASWVARAKPDGYVFLLGSTSEIIQYPLVYDNAPYTVSEDFTPISMVGSSPLALIVNSKLGVDNLDDFIQQAKDNPNKLKFGSAGIGTSTHLAVELLMSVTGIQMRHIPYRGSANIASDVVAGVLDASMPTLSAIKPFDGDERMKVLAASTAEATPLLPGVKGMKEAGVDNYDVALWTGIFGPAGLDEEIANKMHAAVQEALKSPDLEKMFANLGARPVQASRDEFKEMLNTDSARWKALIEENKISVTKE